MIYRRNRNKGLFELLLHLNKVVNLLTLSLNLTITKYNHLLQTLNWKNIKYPISINQGSILEDLEQG